MKRIALTGGTGFVGSHVADALLAAGHTVKALVRRPEAKGWLPKDVEVVRGDVENVASLDELVEGADAVLHVAGRVSARNLDEYLRSNAGGTSNLVEATLRRAPGAHFVLVSSQAAAGPSRDGKAVLATDEPFPVSSYGRSKLAGEKAVRDAGALGLRYTILRPCAVYGPRETAIRDLFVAASRGLVPLLAGGRPKVQMVYVADVVSAVLGALASGGRGETLFVAHPEVLDFRKIAETLAALRTPRARLLPVPAMAIRGAGALVGALSRLSSGAPVFNSEKAGEMLQDAWLCDVGPAGAALGQPFRTSFEEGARLTWDWYLKEGIVRNR